MKVIWKYQIQAATEQQIFLPKNSIVLTCQAQQDVPHIWVLVDIDEKITEPRTFFVYGTGQMIQENIGRYVGTFQLTPGTLIFHVFEKGELQ